MSMAASTSMLARGWVLAALVMGLLAPAAGLHAPARVVRSLRVGLAPEMAKSTRKGGKGFAKPDSGTKPSGRGVLVGEMRSVPASQPVSKARDGDAAATAPDGDELAFARGQRALEAMRQDAGVDPAATKAARAALRRAAYTPEEMAPLDPYAGVMPERVSNRMIKRVVPFAGLPVFGAFALFGGAYYANTQMDYGIPPQAIALATQALFALSFAGITWGVMSTSWDEDEEGTLLGIEQVGKNTAMMREGLARGRAEAVEEQAQVDAAKDGVYMSKEALERANKRGTDSIDSKLPPIS